jgi:hypothetical protein
MTTSIALVGGSPALRALVARYLSESDRDTKIEFFDRRLNQHLRLDFDWSRYRALIIGEFDDALEAATSLEFITRASTRPPTVALGERYFERYRARLVRHGIDTILAVPFTGDLLIAAIDAGVATIDREKADAQAQAESASKAAAERAQYMAQMFGGTDTPDAIDTFASTLGGVIKPEALIANEQNAITARRIVPLMDRARWQRTGVMVTPNIIPGYTIIGSAAPKSDAPVYLASSDLDGKLVVIKLLDQLLKRAPHMRELAKWRATAVEQCGSIHVVRVIEKGHDAPVPFVALEYLRGNTLTERLAPPAEPARVLKAIAQVLHGLDALHRAGLVHLDVKPSNLMWRDENTLVIVDVGVAVKNGSPPITVGTGVDASIGGTPAYMSPEHGQGMPVDVRADLYSVGVMLYELLTGELPFDAYNDAMMLYRHLHDEVPLLPQPLKHLQPLVDTLMAKDREQRPMHAKSALALVAEHSLGIH